MAANLIPNFYRQPLGLPLNWRDEVSGELVKAVSAYLDNRIDGKRMSNFHTNLVCDYMRHYINAPCWDNPEFAEELVALREEAKTLSTPQGVADWIRKTMDIGLDPL